MMKKVVIAYVPVIHAGYVKFFQKHADADAFYVLGEDLILVTAYLSKEIRQLEPQFAVKGLMALEIGPQILVADIATIKDVSYAETIVMPDEDVSREVAEKYLGGKKILFDPVFLRWDKHKTMEEKPVEADQKISKSDFDREVIKDLKIKAEKSSDWWRRIAAALVVDGKIVATLYNEHLPSPHSPYANSDPRNMLHKGVGVELSTAIHAEARLIAEAARDGQSLKGASMYVTVFPCPACAKQIAFSGIKKLYYAGGYQMLDQDKMLKSKGVEIIYVEPEEGK